MEANLKVFLIVKILRTEIRSSNIYIWSNMFRRLGQMIKKYFIIISGRTIIIIIIIVKICGQQQQKIARIFVQQQKIAQ
jgi:hypothetical protein